MGLSSSLQATKPEVTEMMSVCGCVCLCLVGGLDLNAHSAVC